VSILRSILLVAAFVLFVIDSLIAPQPAKPRLLPLGLACWVLAELLGAVGH
jgi:hypothetical protein